ncbi:MAG: hypothetical protein M0R74_08070 [Dehalococcoidia bacterium]|nr:hypothetical protein [Dehalococcoidia bacterium]
MLPALPVLLVACGSNDNDDEPPGDDGSPRTAVLPSAFIRYEPGDAIELMPGTHCWDSNCVDMAGPLTQVEPLELYAGEPIAFSFEAGIPGDFVVNWTSAPPTAPAPEGGVRVWAGLNIADTAHVGTTVPSRTGRYVITVFAQWPGQGDILYALYVDIAPPPGG